MTYLELVNSLEQTLEFFFVITLELVLLFIGISFLAGLMLEFASSEKVRRLMVGDGWFGNAVGAAFSSITPFRSCSTIPLTMGSLEAKAPFGATMSFLLASPLLNPVILGMVLAFMGWEVALVYGMTMFILAVVIGRLWARLDMAKGVKKVRVKGGHSEENDGRPEHKRAASFAWNNFLQVVPHLPIGVLIGALIYGVVPDSSIVEVAGGGRKRKRRAAATWSSRR